MKNKIVILNQDSGYLMIDIANIYVSYGYDVTLVTGRLVERNVKLDSSVMVYNIIQYDRKNLPRRLFTWIIAFIQMLFLVIVKFRKHELLIVSNPPLIQFIPLITQNKFSLLIYDIYPEVLIEMDFISSESIISSLWTKLNKYAYSRANRVYTISDDMRNVLRKYVEEKKIIVVPIWTNNKFLKTVPKNKNIFIEKYNLGNKFIVLYSGNLGYSHNVEIIIEIAKYITESNIIFVIVGEGPKKKILKDKINSYEISNCILLPFQDSSELSHSLSSADLAIVALGKDVSKLSLPSKLFNLLSVGAAILCIASSKSSLSKLVVKNNIGQSFEEHEITEITKFILTNYSNSNTLLKYKKNSKKLSLEFDINNAQKFLN